MSFSLSGVLVRSAGSESSGTAVAALPEWRETAGSVLSLAAVAVLLILLVVAWRGRLWTGWKSTFLSLPRTQRRDLIRQLTGADPIPHARLPLLRDAARFLVRQQFGSLLLIPITCSVVGNALGSGGTFQWILAAVLAGLALVSVIATIRPARRARLFLARQPELLTV